MDAKSLLRAKMAGARIEHPYATYSAAGQLRCSICAVPVKQWDAHLLTKGHRQSVQREKKEAEALARKKRAAEDSSSAPAKRAKVDTVDAETGGGRSALPAGFFSAGNAPPAEEEEEEEEETGSGSGAGAGQGKEEGEEDAELDAFLASLNDEDAPPAAAPKKARRAAYKEPEDEGVASYSAAPQLANQEKDEEQEAEPEESEAERRERVVREEREEVLARLDEEERAQEDADARVDALKARMEALKKRREARGTDAGTKSKGGAVAKAMAKAKAKVAKKVNE